MNNLFIDIGAHIGESIETASSRKYNFYKIIAVEPSTYCQKFLIKYKDKRIQVEQLGLGSQNTNEILYGSGSVGGSLFAEKIPYWSLNEKIKILKFSEWYVKNVSEESLVWIKINAEGAEFDIIQELKLINTKNIVSILVSFDVDKIPSYKNQKHNLIDILNEELKIPFVERSKEIGVAEWLNGYKQLRSKNSLYNLCHTKLRPDIPILRNFRRVIKPFVYKKLWVGVALRFGPNRKR